MGYIPFNYDKINAAAGTYNPSPVKSYNNKTFSYWERALFQRAVFSIDDVKLPEDWTGTVKDFLYYCWFLSLQGLRLLKLLLYYWKLFSQFQNYLKKQCLKTKPPVKTLIFSFF